jgi:hypothetical protein
MFGTLSGVAASAPAAGRRRLAATAKEAIAAVCPNDPCGSICLHGDRQRS